MPIRNQNLSKAVNTLFLIFVVVVYQSLFSGLFTIRQIRLDLPLLILVYVGLTQGQTAGALFGFLSGLLLDVCNSPFLGLGAFIKTCLGFGVGSFKDNLYLENSISRGMVIFLSLLLNDLAYYFFSGGFDPGYTFSIFLNYSLLSGLYTAFAGLAFMWYLQVRRAKGVTA